MYWTRKGIALAILFFIQYILYKSGIVYFKNGWFFILTLVDLLGTYLWVVVLGRFLSQKPAVQSNRYIPYCIEDGLPLLQKILLKREPDPLITVVAIMAFYSPVF